MTVAFCFLVYNIIVRYDIWNLFFESMKNDEFMVYIHPKIVDKNIILPYTFQYKTVKNRVKTTSKDNISIVRATIQLLKEAFVDNKNITHFIFLSQSCIPLYNYEKIMEIVKTTNYSIISSIDLNKKDRINQLSHYLKNHITYTNFVKQQPNMILLREDVHSLLQNDYTMYFQHMQCPDEHYFINILLNVLKKKIIKQQTHFCNYHLHKTQSLEFTNIHNDFIDEIRKMGFLFMRKVNMNTLIDETYLLKNI